MADWYAGSAGLGSLASFTNEQKVVIFGPNGAGKTSLLRTLAGVTPVSRSPEAAYLPQSPYMFRGSVEHNLHLGLLGYLHGLADEIAAELGLTVAPERDSQTLSGGEAQRLALARTLASDAAYVLLDEPLAPIDVQDRQHVATVIARRIGHRGAVIVTHEVTTLATLADEMVVMIDGDIRQRGPVESVYLTPQDGDVANAIGIGNVIDGTVLEHDGTLVAVDAGPLRIWAVGDIDPGVHARVMFGAETVTVFKGELGESSARNHWEGAVESVMPAGRLVEVLVDVGVDVAALLTPGSAEALGLVPGAQVHIAVKATAAKAVVRP